MKMPETSEQGRVAQSLREKISGKQCAELRGVFAARAAQVSQRSNFDEIEEKYSDKKFRRMEKVKMKCTITDASLTFDSPAIYKVACEDGRIKEVVSFTHTYAGQAFDGEEIELQEKRKENI